MAGNRPGPDKGDPRMVDAGRKGGQTVLEERGRDFFREIGRKGGLVTKSRQGAGFYSAIGKKGGKTVKAERGPDYFVEMGRKGGAAERTKRGDRIAAAVGERSREVHEAIKKHVTDHGHPPTLAELGEALAITTATVSYHIGALVRGGYLRRERNKARALTVLK